MGVYIDIESFTPVEITTAEAVKYCRVDNDVDNDLIDSLVHSAQEEALSISHRVFGSATIHVIVFGYQNVIYLPYSKYEQMISFVIDGEESTEYEVQVDRIIITAGAFDECEFSYLAMSDQPEDVKNAILQRTKFTYDFPDDMTMDKPRFFDRVIFRYRDPNSFTS